jgi:hypothetical protein
MLALVGLAAYVLCRGPRRRLWLIPAGTLIFFAIYLSQTRSAVLGAFLIGMAEELSVLVVGSQYRAAVGFIAILAVLTLRPRGLLGERAYCVIAADRRLPAAVMMPAEAAVRKR